MYCHGKGLVVKCISCGCFSWIKKVYSVLCCLNNLSLVETGVLFNKRSNSFLLNNDNNNYEILTKREPLVYRAGHAVQRKKRKRLGQYNSNNKLIHGQYTSRYNPHHTHTHTYTHTHTHTQHTHTHIHHTASQMT